jgi:hypothetical protein
MKNNDAAATALSADADATVAASASAPPPPPGDSHESVARAMHQLAASALRSADAVADSPAISLSTLPPPSLSASNAPSLLASSFSAASVAAMPRRFIAGLDASVTALVRRTARFAESPPTWYFRSTFVASLMIQVQDAILSENDRFAHLVCISLPVD